MMSISPEGKQLSLVHIMMSINPHQELREKVTSISLYQDELRENMTVFSERKAAGSILHHSDLRRITSCINLHHDEPRGKVTSISLNNDEMRGNTIVISEYHDMPRERGLA